MQQAIGTDLDPTGRLGALVGGVENLVEALLRRLRCPRGYLPHQPEYGSLLHTFLGQPYDVATAIAVRAEVERTLLEDDRVHRVASLQVAASDSLDAFQVRAEVECAYGAVEVAGLINGRVA